MALNLIGSCQTAPGASLDKLLSHTSQEVIKREIIMRASGISALGGTVLNLEARAARHCPLAVNSLTYPPQDRTSEFVLRVMGSNESKGPT